MEVPVSYHAYIQQDRKVFTDSRNHVEGAVFFALKGPNFNGNSFVQEVLARGAAYAVVDEPMQEDDRIIRVENVLAELQQLARYNRLVNKATIIAITGSNGKTTTKELCYSIFSKQHRIIATTGNLNNHIGVPLTLLRIKEDTAFAIIEMGANHTGEIRMLCEIALPDVGLITSIGKAHLEGFGSETNILRGKKELFDDLDRRSKTSFYNLNDQKLASIFKEELKHISYGDAITGSQYKGSLLKAFPDIQYSFSGPGYAFDGYSNLFGEYNYHNILSACTLAAHFELSKESIVDGVSGYVPRNMRSEQIHYRNSVVILDAYNANPSSMKAAVNTFDQMEAENKWIVVGEMAELGEFAEQEHEELVSMMNSKSLDRIVLVGELFSKFKSNPNTIVFQDVNSCKHWLNDHFPERSLVLIKGSRSSGLEKLIR